MQGSAFAGYSFSLETRAHRQWVELGWIQWEGSRPYLQTVAACLVPSFLLEGCKLLLAFLGRVLHLSLQMHIYHLNQHIKLKSSNF